MEKMALCLLGLAIGALLFACGALFQGHRTALGVYKQCRVYAQVDLCARIARIERSDMQHDK